MKKILYVIITILLIVVGSLYIHLKMKVKDYSQEIKMLSLNTEAKVVFDEFGIPHIYASNTEDAFKLLGYVQASDRLFQMEMLRRIGSGRLSEILGEKLIPLDKYIRTVGLNENAKRAAAAFEKDTNEVFKANVSAFIAGVNQFIKEGPTPVEFEIIGIPKTPFTITDIYRELGYMGFGFSMELQNEPLFSWVKETYGDTYLNDLGLSALSTDTKIPTQNQHVDTNDYSKISNNVRKVIDLMPVPIFYGSNSWVISGKKTKSGKVLFANDTHIGFAQPSIWYEAHIETPDLKLYGNYMAGIPYPLIGHNMHHSWGLTIFPTDALDLYKETIKNNSSIYKGVWTELETREETIKVKGKDDIIFTVSSTPHGPVITDLDKFSDSFENPVSMWWVANKVTDQKLHAIAILSKSNKFEDLEKASALIDSPGLNIMYGDIEGNIGWFGSAKLIKRPNHVNSKIVLDGASGKDEPLGFYDFKFNPKSINPESGFVYSANNQPDSVNGKLYPGYYYAGARAKVISKTIASKNDWDIESMKQLVLTNKSPIYPDNIKVITKNISPKSETETEALTILRNWDGQHQLSNIAPTIYYKFIYHILNKTMMDEIGENRFNLYLSTPVYLRTIGPLIRNPTSPWWDNTLTDEKETREQIFAEAFTQTIQELTNQFNADAKTWTWDKVHFVEHPHPIGRKKPMNLLFNVGPISAPGGEEVINKIAFTLNASGIYKARSGPAMRILLDFDDIENSISVNPSGQSGYFMNPHYDDQAQMFVDGKFRKQKMNTKDIQNKKTGVWTFMKH